MDILSISGVGNLASEAYGRKTTESEPFSLEGEQSSAETREEERKPLTASDIHDPRRLKQPQDYGLHGLDSKEAWNLLSGLAPDIASSHPSSLAELQAVTEGNLFPSAYV